MSSEALRQAIIERASREAQEIIAKAEKEAERILEEARRAKEQMIQEERRRILAEVRADIRLAEARVKAREILLRAKQRVAEEIINKTIERLRELSEEERARSLSNILEESLRTLRESVERPYDIVIMASERDIGLLPKILSSSGIDNEVRIEKADIMGGLLVKCCNGEVIIDNSYETRLKRAIENILPIILKEVEG